MRRAISPTPRRPVQTTERMTKLNAMLEKDASDPFLLFAMGMEHKKLKQTPQAVEWFLKTLERDPGYCVAYHQAALAYEDAGDIESAKRTTTKASSPHAKRAITMPRRRWRRRFR
jgi:Tfp pilus assembly protein PilF